MKPNNKYGYTESYLKSILKDDWDNFSQWMRGKTMVFDARIKEDVYFTSYVKNYLSRDKDVLDSINMSKESDIIKLVVWRDSNRYIEQYHKDYEFKVAVITTVGFVLKETDKQIVLSQDKMSGDSSGEYRGIIVIPMENVVEIKPLILNITNQ